MAVSQKPRGGLEHRIVYCADCETRRSLASNAGVLACSVCGSEHWMHLSLVNCRRPRLTTREPFKRGEWLSAPWKG